MKTLLNGGPGLSRMSLLAAIAVVAAPAAAQYHGHGGPHGYHRGPGPVPYGGGWYGGHWYHGWYGAGPAWWWVVGDSWLLYPAPVYPYPDPYAAPVVSRSTPAQGAAPQPYWYWCNDPAGYYPYVSSCGSPWQAVAAGSPAAPGAATETGLAPPASPPSSEPGNAESSSGPAPNP
jgi:hypothetical protein